MKVLDELIAGLPELMQPIAERYRTVLLNSTAEELEAFAGQLVNQNWREAYSFLANKMTTEELAAEQERVFNRMKRLNVKYKSNVKIQREIVMDFLSVGLTLLVSRIS